MSKALPPWELMPSWEKQAPVPAVPRVKIAGLENDFIPPMPPLPPPPPPPEPVSVIPTQRPSNAHRRAISLPKNPRPVRPKVPSSQKPTDASPQSTSNTSPKYTKVSSPIDAADPIPPPLPESDPIARTRSRSSTLPGAISSQPTSDAATFRPPIPLIPSYPSPPSSTQSSIFPSNQFKDVREDNSSPNNKSLPPAPGPSVLPTIDTNNRRASRTSKFSSLRRSLSLKILPQNSNGRYSPSSSSVISQSSDSPIPDLPPNWANAVGPSRSLISRKKSSKRLASPSYNEERFAWIETEGSRVVAIGEHEKDMAEYIARTPRTPKVLSLPSPEFESKSLKSLDEKARQRSRRLASPGYIKDKYPMVELGGAREVNKAGDAVLSDGRSSDIREENMKTYTRLVDNRREDQTNSTGPESLNIGILDIHDEDAATSPKPLTPPKDPTTGPRVSSMKYASFSYPSIPSPKRAAQARTTAPPVPKLIPLKFISPPTPEESEDDSIANQYEPIEHLALDVTLQVAPLRLKSNENSPTSLKSTQDTPTRTQTLRPLNPDSTTQPPSSLTSHLISRSTPKKLYNATHSSFLYSCTNGEVSLPLLSKYLTQERIFLHYYLRFLALLLANISTPPKPTRAPSPRTAKFGKNDIKARLTSHLIVQLSRTQNQLSLYTALSEEHTDLNLESWEQGTEDGMSDETRMLVRLFDVFGSAVERGEKSVLVGLVILWVREKAHLEAFKSFSTQTPLPTSHPVSQLLPTFSGSESQSSIEALSKLLDDLFSHIYIDRNTTFTPLKQRKKRPMKNSERSWETDVKEFEEMMEMVLDIQARSWPDVSR